MTIKIIIFVILTLILTVVLAVSQQKINLSFEKISLPQLAPSFAVLILFLLYRELPSKINFHFDNQILTKSLAAVAVPVILFLITFMVGKQMNLNVKITENLSKLLPFMILGMLLGAFGEEVGWRSFLQPSLEKKNGILFSSILVGLIWGLWHIGHYKNGILFMIGFLMFAISASIIISWIMKGTEYNLIISAMFHWSINICFLVFFHNSLTDSKFMLINGVVWLLAVFGFILVSGKDLIST